MNEYNVKYHLKEIKVILQLFNRILSNPNENKYKVINFGRLSNKLNHCKLCIDILHSVGFVKNDNGQRLFYKSTNIEKIANKYQILLILVEGHTQPPIAMQSYVNIDI